jgi:alkyl hydroperoxide reductase subunit F
MTPVYDVIVIGAGPAGITAGVYAARKRMEMLIVTVDIGGQTAWSGEIDNYTGYQFITGPELTDKFEEHLRKYKVTLKSKERVDDIRREKRSFVVVSEKGEYRSRTVIIASGKRPRELGVPGEKEFKNRGLTYCATCDGPLFADKDVAVIGGGNSGLDAGLQLVKIARRVYLIEVAPAIRGDKIMQEKLAASGKATILTDTAVTAIEGDTFVQKIRVKTGDREKDIPVQGVFVEIGLRPNSQFARIADKNQWGEIKVTPRNETNIPGLFAAGDVTDVPEKQIIVAAGEGAKAAISAFRYLSRMEEPAGGSWVKPLDW